MKSLLIACPVLGSHAQTRHFLRLESPSNFFKATHHWMSRKLPKLGPIYSVAKPIPLVSRYLCFHNHTHCFFPSLPHRHLREVKFTHNPALFPCFRSNSFSLIPNTPTLLALHSMIIIGIFTLGALSDTNDIYQTDIISSNIQLSDGTRSALLQVISMHRILRWSRRNQIG